MCGPACPSRSLRVRVCTSTYLRICSVSVYDFVWVCRSRRATSPHRDTGLKVCGLACDVHCPALKVPSQSVITSKETGQQRGELTPPPCPPYTFLLLSSPLASLLFYCPLYLSTVLSFVSSVLFFLAEPHFFWICQVVFLSCVYIQLSEKWVKPPVVHCSTWERFV